MRLAIGPRQTQSGTCMNPDDDFDLGETSERLEEARHVGAALSAKRVEAE
jgi:hypothetical protein